ncbi:MULTISPECIES: hypothetical protein [Vibrio]|uniref:hypothetical protein n=1 Tax=Vibrio TaxID=662 RepID=UPI001EEC09AC|nr:hypothetical protein [Vibrio vulnificus]HCG5950836.1 hypothetical protein [Vibrio parahaemolyticus]HDM8222180.1 hypothetical protein [Vibrio campbellii]MCG6311827.1 hypothetical protein [Vibrio vulnificus]HCG8321440.1 hypothetical protein [Vibrio parahaemolyticus]HCG9257526.1 hypothetical protein [Vibrio parahaemolyticus]
MKYRSKWEICFNAYKRDCTRIVIFKESLKFISFKFKVLIFGSIILFGVFLTLAMFAAFDDNRNMYYIYLVAFLIFEASSLISVFKAQSKYTKEEYSDYELSQAPPEDYKDQKARYLKFRRALRLNDIQQSHISDILEILDSRIAVCENSGVSVQKIVGFSVTFAMSILVATMKNLNIQTIAQIGVVGISLIAFLYILHKLTPNTREQLYELKYFLTMFSYEEREKSL